MSVTNINTIPYNGGTIALHGVDITSVALSNTKFIHFYAQSTPNLVFAHVVNTTGLEGGTATSTNGPQFAFGAASTRIRGWKIATGRVMVLIGNELRVMEVASDDTITMKAAKLSTELTGLVGHQWENSTGGTDTLLGMNYGTFFKAINLVDNQLVVAIRVARGGSNTTLTNITYNPTTDVLTKGTSGNVSVEHNSYRTVATDLHFAKVPSSSNVVVYSVGTPDQNFTYSTANGSKPTLQNAGLWNPTTGQFIRVYNTGASVNDVNSIVALSETQLLGFIDGAAFRVHSGSNATNVNILSVNNSASGSWGATVTFSATGAGRVCTHAEMLNDSYMLTTISEPVTANINGYSMRLGKQFLRIIRFVDTTFAEVIEANQDIALSELGIPLNADLPMVEKVGQYTFVFKSKANATITDTKINLRSIFGGSE